MFLRWGIGLKNDLLPGFLVTIACLQRHRFSEVGYDARGYEMSVNLSS